MTKNLHHLQEHVSRRLAARAAAQRLKLVNGAAIKEIFTYKRHPFE